MLRMAAASESALSHCAALLPAERVSMWHAQEAAAQGEAGALRGWQTLAGWWTQKQALAVSRDQSAQLP